MPFPLKFCTLFTQPPLLICYLAATLPPLTIIADVISTLPPFEGGDAGRLWELHVQALQRHARLHPGLRLQGQG